MTPQSILRYVDDHPAHEVSAKTNEILGSYHFVLDFEGGRYHH